MLVNKDFKEFLELLNAHKIRCLLVGGYAVGHHGYPRFTQDMDIFYQRNKPNAKAMWRALVDFGFGNIGLSENDFLRKDQVIQLGNPPNRIDLLNSIEGVAFSEAWSGRVTADYGGVPVYYLGKYHLRINKRAVNRNKDRADLEHLPPDKGKRRPPKARKTQRSKKSNT